MASDGDGTDNYQEFVIYTDPTDPAFPTATQRPHPLEVTDAQRRAELGPDYWWHVGGSRDGNTRASDGVIQPRSNRLVGFGLERVTARVAAGLGRSTIKDLRLIVPKSCPRTPRERKSVFTKKERASSRQGRFSEPQVFRGRRLHPTPEVFAVAPAFADRLLDHGVQLRVPGHGHVRGVPPDGMARPLGDDPQQDGFGQLGGHFEV